MHMAWVIVAALCAGVAVWLWLAPVPLASRLESVGQGRDRHAGDNWRPDAALVLELLLVALEQGAAIPRALQCVGEVLGGGVGTGLAYAARQLVCASSWSDAWCLPCDHLAELINGAPYSAADIDHAQRILRLVGATLRESWERGIRAAAPLRAAMEQLESTERTRIEQRAQKLSVKLLFPTGLCFLPAFLCIAVIPTIASFAMGM